MSGNRGWEAVVTYRSRDLGSVDVTYDLLELDELWEYVEDGPDRRTILNIQITPMGADEPLCVEETSWS